MALFEVNCFSETLGENVRFFAILPQGTTGRQIGVEEKSAASYPVMYLLHGLSDDESIWLRRTTIELLATQYGIAVIMPSTRRGWYSDGPRGAFYSYVAEELPQLVHQFFPTISTRREDTFSCGISMGGYGALKLAFSHPERFAAAAAMSGALDMSDPWLHDTLRDEHVLDHEPVDSKDDIFRLAKEVLASDGPKPKVFMWCGLDDRFIRDNRMMRDLIGGKLDLTYSETAGNHGWIYWNEHLAEILAWLPIEKK